MYGDYGKKSYWCGKRLVITANGKTTTAVGGSPGSAQTLPDIALTLALRSTVRDACPGCSQKFSLCLCLLLVLIILLCRPRKRRIGYDAFPLFILHFARRRRR